LKSSKAGEVDTRFRVACPAKDAAGFCAEREDVTRLDKITG
jgi:hypothetical protein